MTTKADLKYIRNVQARVARLKAEAYDAKDSLLPASPPLSDMPRNPNKVDKMAEAFGVIDEKERAIQELSEIESMKDKIRQDIARLSSPMLMEVIELYYFDRLPTWYDVAEALDYSDRQVQNFHSMALEELKRLQ